MSADAARPIAGSPAVAPADAPAATDAQRLQIRRLAQEFEAILMTQMLRDMRRSLVNDESHGLGAEAMTDTTDVELGRTLTKSGGFGLTQVLLRAFERQLADTRPDAASSAPADAALSSAALVRVPTAAPGARSPDGNYGTGAPAAADRPASDSVPSSPVDAAGRVTSAFGWRLDPFTRGTRFHAGVDIAAAYGSPVTAVAAGQVVYAGEKGGYGDTVVIQHPDGVQTMYAHLSAHHVEAGDAIEAGQSVGAIGSTGRSTGPHLHFEVRRNGQAVDPAAHD